MLDPNQKLNITIVGAHVDDHWYGVGGTMLKAARKGHRVTVVQAVTTYCSWPVVTGREAEFTPHITRLTEKTGINVLPLGHDYLRLVSNPDLMQQLAQAIAITQPDILICPWVEDSNQDHVAIGHAARIVGIHAPCFLPPPKGAPMKLPRQILHYALDENPKDFHPDTYIDTGDVLFDVLELNNLWDELYAKSPSWLPGALRRMTITDHHNRDRSVTLNFESECILGRSLVYGLQAGTRFAEAFVSHKHTPAHQNLLALL